MTAWTIILDIIGCVGTGFSVFAVFRDCGTRKQVNKIRNDMQSLNKAMNLSSFSSKFSDFHKEFLASAADEDFNKGGSAKTLIDRLLAMITEINQYHGKLSSSSRVDVESFTSNIRTEISSCRGFINHDIGMKIAEYINKIDIILCDEVNSRFDEIVKNL